MERKRIAIVVQRYGPEVLGGSESLARSLAHLLADVYDVDVLTTCAKDYVTWKNEFPPGESMDGPVRVIRFAVDRQRSKWFNLYNALMLKVPHTRWMEELWMKLQGPCSAELVSCVEANRKSYHAVVFLTYLYGTTYYASRALRRGYVLVPTAHDEPYLQFGLYRDVFEGASRVICLTGEEQGLVENALGVPRDRCSVIGVPLEDCEGDPVATAEKYGLEGNYLVYVGRIDAMKNVYALVEYFNRYVAERDSDLRLVLCGDGPLQVPSSERIRRLGFVPEGDKFGILRGALASVQPSRYESYSISTIESMACGTPVLANGDCEVLEGHCKKSGGGITYTSYDEFRDSLDRIHNENGLRERMAQTGRSYALENYSTSAVGKKYISLLDGLTTNS